MNYCTKGLSYIKWRKNIISCKVMFEQYTKWWWWWWYDDDEELFLWYGWPTKDVNPISSWDHCQRFSPSRISDTPRGGLEPVQNLSVGLVEWSYSAVITATLRRHNLKNCVHSMPKSKLPYPFLGTNIFKSKSRTFPSFKLSKHSIPLNKK